MALSAKGRNYISVAVSVLIAAMACGLFAKWNQNPLTRLHPAQGTDQMAKRKAKAKSSSVIDTSMLTDFFSSPTGRQLLADIVMAAAGAAAAALLASNRGTKAMGKAAMAEAQSAVLGVIMNAAQGTGGRKAIARRPR